MSQQSPQQPTRPNTTQNTPFDAAPLWSHVTVVKSPTKGGGNRVWVCNYCNKQVTGSYTKVKSHLLQLKGNGVDLCNSISDQTKDELRREHEAAENRKARQAVEVKKRQEYMSLPPGSDIKQQKRKKGTVESCFNVVERDECDKEMARMIYASALPFSLVKNPFFRRFCLRLSNSKIAGYVPPTYNRMRTTLLEQEKAHVNVLLQPFRDSWRKRGVSLCSDGWGDRQKRPLINVMAASGGNSMFVKSFDTSGNIKDSDYVASLFLNVIDQEGPDNVVQIITDNAGNFKAAGLSIEAKYPHIFWTPCVVHSLNLALKSICELGANSSHFENCKWMTPCVVHSLNLALKSICEPGANSSHFENCKWISTLISDCDEITMFILNHGKALTLFQKHSKHMLVKTGETRFASHVIMAQRLLLVKNSLEKTVLDPNWKTFRKTNLESKADHVKECIISDRWWDKLEYFIGFTSPIYNMIRLGDTDTPCLHLIYDMWDTMIEEVREKIFKEEGKDLKTGESSFFNDIQHILEARWNKSNTPLHCMAHSLVPKYYSQTWLESGSGVVPRVAPNEDQEVSLNRSKCFKKMYPNSDDLRKVNAEYGMFSAALGFFSESHVMDARIHEEPLSWWASYGSETPMLQNLAFKLLSQPASSSCCERNWSSFGNIQNVKRNRLASSRAEDLVHVHTNLRLISRKGEEYTKGPSKYWDVERSNGFVELPPELCSIIMSPMSVSTCYSFSFASAIMYRIESLLIASSLKKMHSEYCKQNVIATAKIPTIKVLEAITTKKCQEKFDLESLEALGDSFLKYASCQQVFKVHQDKHEGILSIKKEKIISNANLCKLGCSRKLPGLIRNEPFDPKLWIIPGDQMEDFHEIQLSTATKIFSKGIRKIKSKVVADVVEALIGVFLSCGGEVAALSFMNWLGIEVDFLNVPYKRSFPANPEKLINISYLESILNYSFSDASLLVEALTHGSYMLPEIPQCYQRLEFLGDSVLDYLITMHLYNEYPEMSPGLLTDLRSASVNNDCYSLSAVKVGLQKYILHASQKLQWQITSSVQDLDPSTIGETFGWESENPLPKVLGDVIESLAGAILVDSGYRKDIVFRSIRPLLDPLVSPKTLKLQPVRELHQLCRKENYVLKKPVVSCDNSLAAVTVEVEASGVIYKESCTAPNKAEAKKLASKAVLKSLKESMSTKPHATPFLSSPNSKKRKEEK